MQTLHEHFRLAIRVVVSLSALCAVAVLAQVDGSSRPRFGYDTPVRTSRELTAALSIECKHAQRLQQPLLLEFSAPWCSDCLKLHIMKQDEGLAAELARWPHLVVNVGRFDQHADLLEAFGVRSIARWVILRPKSCEAPVEKWPRVTQRTLEPDTGEERSVTPADLAKWLETLRTP